MTFVTFVAVPALVLAYLLAPVLLSLGESGPDASDTGSGGLPPGNDRPTPPSPTCGDSATVPLSSVTVRVSDAPFVTSRELL